MVQFNQDGIVFEDTDNVDQYDVRLDGGELVVTYLPSDETWRFQQDGGLTIRGAEGANINDVSDIQASSDVDHNQTSNRTHTGDDLTPNSTDVDEFMGNAVYPTIGDIPESAEQTGNQVYVQDDGDGNPALVRFD